MPDAENKPKLTLKPEVPVVALKGLVMFPKITVPLLLSDPKAVAAIDSALASDRLAVFVAVKEDDLAEPQAKDLYQVGTVSKIVEAVKQPDGTMRLMIEGLERARVKEFTADSPFFKARAGLLPQRHEEKSEAVEAQMYAVVNQFKEAVNAGAPVPFDVLLVVMNLNDPWQLSDLVALNLDFRTEEKQKILEAEAVLSKLELVAAAIARQLKVLQLSKKLQTETGKELGKMEREMFLREQLKSIEKELGVLGGRTEVEELKAKIEKAGMPAEPKAIAEKELLRLQGMPSFSPEVSYIRTYLDWLVELPWSKKTESQIDVNAAKKILDSDHYGLEKVKERILEYLAVQKLVGRIRGPILCFAGPPGTGKTSLGKSIARALGRKFVRMSLGGVRDEAEIRGFRRTYVGALPGRIIQGVNQAGSKNPVFMLDEIDKLGADFRGDPSAALLEALDPEQNSAFSDHYLEVSFDLSDVMFITTANILDTVPPALRDRMEVIDFPGYTEEEKFHIAKQHLLPKLWEMHGLKPKQMVITEPAIRAVIRLYTLEAGVRNLERSLAAVCRKIAREVATGARGAVTIGVSDLAKYLGAPHFSHEEARGKGEVGVVTGLAWTEAGGEVLTIEAAKMPGAGKLIITGHLGQVMQESVEAAFSFARAFAKEEKIKDQFYKTSDVHVHVPAGAIPKDGPSAGIAIATALVSLVTDKPVKKAVAMTGEVTLRGRVLEIGGVKEKILAAHRAGVQTVILPEGNKKDLDDVPKEVRRSLKFIFAKTMDEVLKSAIQAR
ncbi:endopeptidase La [Patescibacteria group bacterium]|nr:MAG: endopeptidase La [Patescibacteria group bacterium]